jgi:hypothetical protein
VATVAELDDLYGPVDFDDVPKNQRKLGLVVGAKKNPKELEAAYGGPQSLAKVEFEELDQ